MKRLLLFTAGTSLLANLKDPEKKFFRQDLVEGLGYKEAGAWRMVLRRADVLRAELVAYAEIFAPLNLADAVQRSRTTAEMAGFYLLRKGPEQFADRLVLLCSDTGPGAFCALANGMLLGEEVRYYDRSGKALTLAGMAEKEAGHGFHSSLKIIRLPQVELIVVNDRDPRRPQTFEQTAIPALVKTIAGLHYNRSAEEYTVLNYTGGFKAAIPTLTQASAVASDIDLVCLYEDATELIQQPLVPIDLGQAAEERLLFAGKDVEHRPDPLRDYTALSALKNGLPRAEWAFYEEKNGRVQLSSLGSALQELLEARARRREQRQ